MYLGLQLKDIDRSKKSKLDANDELWSSIY